MLLEMLLGSVQYELFCNSNFNYGTVSTIEESIEMGCFKEGENVRVRESALQSFGGSFY